MTNFAQLKEIHNTKLEQARKLANELSKKIIARDLAALAREIPERLKMDGRSGYVLDEMILVSINKDGSLELEDRRGTAFLWGFEVDFTEQLRIGDVFMHGDEIYSVQHLHEHSFDGVEQVLQEIVNEIDEAIHKLRTKNDLNTWSYQYYCAHEDITCETLSDVVSVVVRRQP